MNTVERRRQSKIYDVNEVDRVDEKMLEEDGGLDEAEHANPSFSHQSSLAPSEYTKFVFQRSSENSLRQSAVSVNHIKGNPDDEIKI